MQKLKALYISSYSTFVVVAALYCIYRAALGPAVPWIGALLTTLPAALFFGRAFIVGDLPRTSAGMPTVLLAAVVGAAIVGVSRFRGLTVDAPALGVAVAGVVGWLIYNYWYSHLDRPSETALVVGQPLPAFELETEEGEPIASTSFVGRPLLLLFYRGNWCPLCMAQIREVAAQYRQLEQSGVQVVCVSPQPHDNTRKLAAKFDVPFRFLVDKNNRAAQRLGIFAKDGLPFGLQALGYDRDTVLPTVVITDAAGKIIFADLTDNYRVRPEPSTFAAILNSAGAN